MPLKKETCFVIMPYNGKVERVWTKVYEPTIKAAGLEPVRIDQASTGIAIQLEILDHLRHAKLIVADITHERPNCYLEVGIVLGLDRSSDLILCCREDHNPHGPKFNATNPKVHFDLNQYPFLWWNSRKLAAFSIAFAEWIQRRLAAPKTATRAASSRSSVSMKDLAKLLGKEIER